MTVQNRYTYRTLWEQMLDDQSTSMDIDGLWDIPEHFVKNLQKESPETFNRETLHAHFNASLVELARQDNALDGRDYRLHPTAPGINDGTIFYYGQELNWWISLLLQPDSDVKTILTFARTEYQTRIDSIRGIILKIGQQMTSDGYTITLSQFRQLFLKEIHELTLGVSPSPFVESSNPLTNFIASPAHFGFTLAEEPGFVYDHITQRLAYSGVMGEVIALPFGDTQPNTLDLFYHEVQMLIYDTVPDRFKRVNASAIEWSITYNSISTLILTDTELVSTGVYRIPSSRFVRPLEKVTVEVNGVPLVEGDEFQLLPNKQDIAFNRYHIPISTDVITLSIHGYVDESKVPNALVEQDGRPIFDIRNYVYYQPDDKTLIRCYTQQDVLDEEEKRFAAWLTREQSWKDRHVEPFKNLNDINDPFSWNYKEHITGMPAVWYEIYEQEFGTSGPQFEPWVIQGYDAQPDWWDTDFPPVDGLYPYQTMWSRIQSGTPQPSELTTPTSGFVLNAAPTYTLPIDTNTGVLLAPYSNTLVTSMFTTVPTQNFDDFVFGDNSPTEMQWRNSPDYRWDIIDVGYHLKPIDFVSLCWDGDRMRTWLNGLVIDRNQGKVASHKDMVFYGQSEQVIDNELIVKTYDYMSDGFTTVLSGQAHDFTPIETFTGNGLLIDFDLEYPWHAGDASLVEINGAVVTYGVDYSFVDNNGDGNYDSIQFSYAPGSFAATTGREWDARPTAIVPITGIIASNNQFVFNGNYDNKFPTNLVIEINGSTANDGHWTLTDSYFDSVDTNIEVIAPTATHAITAIDPTTNEFIVAGDVAADYHTLNRFFVTNSTLFDGRWVVSDATSDGTTTRITASTDYALTLASYNASANQLNVVGDETIHATVGTEVVLNMAAGRDTTWAVASSTFSAGSNETTIQLNFPTNSFNVVGVDLAQNEFIIAGYQLNVFPLDWTSLLIYVSTSNDGTYTISNVYYNDDGNTVIRVNEVIPSSTADGMLILDGTISALNTITNTTIVAGIDAHAIISVDASLNIIGIDADYSSEYTAGKSVSVFGSTGNDGDWQVITSTFDGFSTSIELVPPRDIFTISGINAVLNTFTVPGDATAIDQTGLSIIATGTIGNDGTYTATGSVFDGFNTIISVAESIPSPTAPTGNLSLVGDFGAIADGVMIVVDGVIDGTIDSTVDGQIVNEQNWDWDIVGWDDISLGISVPVRVRVGTPADILEFDGHDDLDVYIDGSSYTADNITTNFVADNVTLAEAPLPFSVIRASVYNPRDIIEKSETSDHLKLTSGLNQWYSQFYLFRSRLTSSQHAYSDYWREWQQNAVYRTNNIVNPQSMIVQAYGDLVFQDNVDYFVELDQSTRVKDFYIDSFLVTVAEKTETSFDVGGTAPQSTIFHVDNFDKTRNSIKTAIARKDVVLRYTRLPTDDALLPDIDDNAIDLKFRTNDTISCVIDSVFYPIDVNVVLQTVTLSVDAINAINVAGSEVVILIEPIRKQISSHEVNDPAYTSAALVTDLITNDYITAALSPTNYFAPLEFEVDEFGELATQEIILPSRFTPTEFVEFFAEHERYLLESGGVFDEVDDSIYRNYDRLLADFIKFVDSLELRRDDSYGDRFLELNALQNAVKIGTKFGQLSKVESESDFYSKINQDILDVNGDVISTRSLQVLREDGLASISLIGDNTVTAFFASGIPFTPNYVSYGNPLNENIFPQDGHIWFDLTTSKFYVYDDSSSSFLAATTQYTSIQSPLAMYTARFGTDTFESIIRFENDSSTAIPIFIPLTGTIIRRVYVQFEKARTYFGRPSFSGFALVQNETTGLLDPVRNIESQTRSVGDLYDPFNVPLDNNFADAIPDLLGLQANDYLKRFLGGASPRSMTGFQQGFIQQKGASTNVNAFVEAIKSITNVDLYEVWAYKLAEYGDATGDDYITIKITEKEGSREILGIHFTDLVGTEVADRVLVEVKENDPTRFTNLLDANTTKDGNRFYFPAVERGSVTPEWERDVVAEILTNPNYLAATITGTNLIGFDFGTDGIGGRDKTKRLVAATLHQDATNFANTVDVQVFDEFSDTWVVIAQNVPVVRKTNFDEVIFPRSTSARKWRVVGVDLNAGAMSATIELHEARAIPDYKRIGRIDAYNTQIASVVASWYPWDPIENIHTPEAYQYIDHESDHDPAMYRFSAGDASRVEESRSWGEEHVGEVWWNKSDYAVVDYKNVRDFPTATQRASLWGKLASGTKVSVYEWVKSPVPPADYAEYILDYEGSENSLSERIPSGVVRSTTDYAVEAKIDRYGDEIITYYFWVKGATVRGYTKHGALRSLTIKQITLGLQHPNNIATNKFSIIDHYLPQDDLPPRFTKWFGNAAASVFTSDYIELHLDRHFLLSGNLQAQDFRANRHEEWTLLHRGQPELPPAAIWDDIVAVLADETCANAIDWDSNDPNRCFMPRDELLRLLNRRVLEIRPEFFPTGYESANVSGSSSFEINTPFDGAAEIQQFDVNSTDPYRRIRSLGDTNINYFNGTPEHLITLMSRTSPTSFYNTSTPEQVLELFFDILEESIGFDTKKSDIFKTSYVAYDAERLLVQTPTWDGTFKDLDLILDFVNDEAKPFHTQINLDISRLVLAYHEFIEVSVAEVNTALLEFSIADFMDVGMTDSSLIHTEMLLADVMTVPVTDSIPIFVDENSNADSFDVGMTDDVIMHVDMSVADAMDVACDVYVAHSLAIVDFPQYTDEMGVLLDDQLLITESMWLSDAMDVAGADITTGVDYSTGPEYMNISMADSDAMIDYVMNMSELVDVNFADAVELSVFNYAHTLAPDAFDAVLDETLRIDIEEYDVSRSWFYAWYMIHDGGQNLNYSEGDPFGNPADGIYMGRESGRNEDPTSEDWFRWDGVKLDDVYYISSYDNFETYDTDLLGYDLDTIGRAGYIWDGVGSNTILSNEPSAKFLRARPIRSGLPVDLDHQFVHTQPIASQLWSITHNLFYVPVVRVYDSAGNELIPTRVISSSSTTVIEFSSPTTGIARLL